MWEFDWYFCHLAQGSIVPLNTINTNPYRTWEMVIAGGDQYARIYDTRMFYTGPCTMDNNDSDNEDAICNEPVMPAVSQAAACFELLQCTACDCGVAWIPL